MSKRFSRKKAIEFGDVAAALPSSKLFRDENTEHASKQTNEPRRLLLHGDFRFPGELLDKLSSLENLACASALSEFSKIYGEVQKQHTDRNSYDFCVAVVKIVLDMITKIQESYPASKQAGLESNVNMLFSVELILQRNPSYRSHFLHSVHIMLLGYVALNKLKPCFAEAHQQALGNTLTENEAFRLLEESWFLTAIFHDYGYFLQKLEELIKLDFNFELSVNSQLAKSSAIKATIKQIAALQESAASGKLPSEWDFDLSRTKTNSKAAKVLLAELKGKKSHAVFGSVFLLNRFAADLRDEAIGRVVLPAIPTVALHHLDIQGLLSACGGQKLSFKKQPLAFLLIFCDMAQEWNRPSSEPAIQTASARLEALYVNDDSIELRIDCFDSEKRYKTEVPLLRNYVDGAILNDSGANFKIVFRHDGVDDETVEFR